MSLTGILFIFAAWSLVSLLGANWLFKRIAADKKNENLARNVFVLLIATPPMFLSAVNFVERNQSDEITADIVNFQSVADFLLQYDRRAMESVSTFKTLKLPSPVDIDKNIHNRDMPYAIAKFYGNEYNLNVFDQYTMNPMFPDTISRRFLVDEHLCLLSAQHCKHDFDRRIREAETHYRNGVINLNSAISGRRILSSIPSEWAKGKRFDLAPEIARDIITHQKALVSHIGDLKSLICADLYGKLESILESRRGNPLLRAQVLREFPELRICSLDLTSYVIPEPDQLVFLASISRVYP